MVPVEVAPLEERHFQLVIQRAGANPGAFKLRKLANAQRSAFRVRVVGGGAATVYDVDHPQGWLAPFAADMANGLFGPKGTPAPDPALAALMDAAGNQLAQQGLDGLLAFLNARVAHRFTGIYRVDGPVMRNVALFDRHRHLDPLDLKVVPCGDSFCQFVLRDGLFLTTESGGDARLQGHPYQGVMGCYVGVPIRGDGGALRGTLCHFDLQSHELPDAEVLFLERVAAMLPRYIEAMP